MGRGISVRQVLSHISLTYISHICTHFSHMPHSHSSYLSPGVSSSGPPFFSPPFPPPPPPPFFPPPFFPHVTLPLFPCITGCLFSGWLETLDDPSMGSFGRNRPGMRITAWNSGLWYARATHASLRLMTILAHRMESEPNTWDQASSHSRPPCIRMSARAICIRMCATAHTFFRTHTRGKPCSSGGVW